MPKFYPGDAVEIIGQDVKVPNLLTDGNVDGIDVSDLDAAVVKKVLFDAQTILAAVNDNDPVALTIAASRILGRKSTGDIIALTGAELRTIIDFTAQARSAAVSDSAYAAGWNGVTTIAPSKNAVYDKIETLGGATLTISETEVYNAAPPGATAWTDLDLSAVVGSNKVLVLLKVTASSGGAFAIRQNGDTDEFYSTDLAERAGGTQLLRPYSTIHLVGWLPTDSAGIIEWIFAYTSGTVTIDVMAYIKP